VLALPPGQRVGRREKISAVLGRSAVLAERQVRLSRRVGRAGVKTRKIHPPREQRTARLAISAEPIELPRTEYVSTALPARLRLNVVRVAEVDAPADAKPVEWVLLTNQPIQTPDQVLAVVDDYRARWMIEEYFKALKSGCLIEERQLEDIHNLLNALATLIPVAWQLLRLRYIARSTPEAAATDVLTPTQLQVLRTVTDRPLGRNPTAGEAMLAVARLGGHLVHNGDPGWQSLGHGLQQLLLLERGWIAATSRRRITK